MGKPPIRKSTSSRGGGVPFGEMSLPSLLYQGGRAGQARTRGDGGRIATETKGKPMTVWRDGPGFKYLFVVTAILIIVFFLRYQQGSRGVSHFSRRTYGTRRPRSRDIGLQQDPRLQDPARRALSFPNQRFKPFAFLAAQPHNILLYRNLLRGSSSVAGNSRPSALAVFKFMARSSLVGC
jgi:hypothetical protein